jgi:hypothetical protein
LIGAFHKVEKWSRTEYSFSPERQFSKTVCHADIAVH